MKTIILSTLLSALTISISAQNDSFDYFGLSSPGDKIELFAPGIISQENSYEYSLAISPLGDEVFFVRGSWPDCKIMYLKKINDRWTKAQIAGFSENCNATEPAFSPDGKFLFFSSNKEKTDQKDYAIWRIEKKGNEWGNAKKVIDFPETDIWEFHPSIANDGTVYFCWWDSKNNKGKIYKSVFSDGIYSKPKKVDILFAEGSSVTNPFINPDKKYIIVSAKTEGAINDFDTFISYRKDNKWTKAINFDDRFNTSEVDDSFDISPDGKFLFMYKNGNIYRAETKGVIK